MAKKKDDLGTRMKGYEATAKQYLMRHNPVIIRVDGKAFHAFTKGMIRPFDDLLMEAMQETMQYMCANIQNCVFGYTQSDEITLVLIDYKNLNTSAWFDNVAQKMASVAASMATMAFNRVFREKVEKRIADYEKFCASFCTEAPDLERDMPYLAILKRKLDNAMFDARAFSVPREEVVNCLIWRQMDATRNSIQMVGQAHFSHKQLQGKNCDEIQEMLWQQKHINWSRFSPDQKRGVSCYKMEVIRDKDDPCNPGNTIEVPRRVWHIEHNTPVFTQDREFIEKWI